MSLKCNLVICCTLSLHNMSCFANNLMLNLCMFCQIEGEIFNRIGTLGIYMMYYQSQEVFSNIFFEFSESLSGWNVSFKCNTDSTSHLELPNTENVSFSKGYAKFYIAILMSRCLKSVTTLLSCVNFLLINITGLELAENPSFNLSK